MLTKQESFLSILLKSKKPTETSIKETCVRKKRIPLPKSTEVAARHFYDKARFQLERGLSNGFSMYKER